MGTLASFDRAPAANEAPAHRGQTTETDAKEVCIEVDHMDEARVTEVIEECRRLSRIMLRNLVFAMLVLVAALLFQALCMWNSDRIYATYRRKPGVVIEGAEREWEYSMDGLYDPIHALLGKWYGLEGFSIRYADTIIAILFMSVCTKLLIFAPAIFSCQVMARYMVLTAVIYTLRGLFIAATVVPVPDRLCAVFDPNESFFAQYLHVIKGYFSITDTCTDMIISGHTASSTTIAQTFIFHNGNWIVNAVIITITATVGCTLIAARAHYTVDVMFGAFFSLQVYANYMRMIERIGRRAIKGKRPGDSVLDRTCRALTRLEMVEERAALFIKLKQLQSADLSDVHPQLRWRMGCYIRIFGLEDETDPQCVYKGFKNWSLSSIRLITDCLRRSYHRKWAARDQRRSSGREMAGEPIQYI